AHESEARVDRIGNAVLCVRGFRQGPHLAAGVLHRTQRDRSRSDPAVASVVVVDTRTTRAAAQGWGTASFPAGLRPRQIEDWARAGVARPLPRGLDATG